MKSKHQVVTAQHTQHTATQTETMQCEVTADGRWMDGSLRQLGRSRWLMVNKQICIRQAVKE